MIKASTRDTAMGGVPGTTAQVSSIHMSMHYALLDEARTNKMFVITVYERNAMAKRVPRIPATEDTPTVIAPFEVEEAGAPLLVEDPDTPPL